MTPAEFNVTILTPSMVNFPAVLISQKASLLLLAIAGQEAGWTDRIQQPNGPARGFWQSEKGGMLKGVIGGPYAPVLDKFLSIYSLPADPNLLFEALAWHDPLSCFVARLGLFMDPSSLPAVGNEDDAWACYEKNWQPGKPSRSRWSAVYPQSLAAIGLTPTS